MCASGGCYGADDTSGEGSVEDAICQSMSRVYLNRPLDLGEEQRPTPRRVMGMLGGARLSILPFSTASYAVVSDHDHLIDTYGFGLSWKRLLISQDYAESTTADAALPTVEQPVAFPTGPDFAVDDLIDCNHDDVRKPAEVIFKRPVVETVDISSLRPFLFPKEQSIVDAVLDQTVFEHEVLLSPWPGPLTPPTRISILSHHQTKALLELDYVRKFSRRQAPMILSSSLASMMV